MDIATKPTMRRTKDGPSLIDGHVGLRLRARRNVLGLSQKDLGETVGLTFQQIQKYEQGANRISSGRLYEFSHILGVPVDFFYEDLPDQLVGYTQRGVQSNVTLSADQLDGGIMNSRATIDLVRVFYSIDDEMVRQRFMDLMREAARICEKP